MSYCGTELVEYLSQVAYTQLRYLLSRGTLQSFVNGTLIPQAEAIIDNYVGRRDGTLRHFNPHGTDASPTTITLDGNAKSVLFVPPKYCPMIGFGTVNISNTAVGDPTLIKVHTQYVDYDGGHFSEGKQNVELIGSYGYATVPNDVEFLTGRLCANVLLDMARRYSAEDVAHTAPGQTDFSTMFASVAIFSSPTVFTKDMKSQLSNYRIKWVDFG